MYLAFAEEYFTNAHKGMGVGEREIKQYCQSHSNNQYRKNIQK